MSKEKKAKKEKAPAKPAKTVRRHRTKAKKGQRGQGFDMEKASKERALDRRYGFVIIEN